MYICTFYVLAEEYLRFLKSTYPDYKKRLISVPKSFQYSSVKTHGIPSEGRRRLQNYEGDDRKQLRAWVTATAGQSAEEKIFNMLTTMFYDEPCLLVSGFTENDLLKVVRENLKNGKEGKGSVMSDRVSQLSSLYNNKFKICFRNELFTI